MASLQKTLFSLQSKLPPSSFQIARSLPIRKTYPIRIKTGSSSSAAGARMSATAASSYAMALADVAKRNDSMELTVTDIEKLDQVFADPQVLNFFANPTITIEKKRQVIDDIVKSSSLQSHTSNFLNVLVDANRINIVTEIVKEFELVYNKLTDTQLAEVRSVVKLEPPQLAQIAKQVQKLTGAKNVRVKTVIDPSLVAGFTIRYGDSGSKLIDMSVKKQLEDIAEQLELVLDKESTIMSSNVSSTTLKSWRDRPPSSYSIKVQNRSQLESSTLYSNGKFQSRRFSSGDYKWRLIIYPKGNDKDNGSGFISMYVGIDTTTLMSTTPTEVYADLRFFIYNKKENKYFTIQDVQAKPFNTLRTMCGLAQVLPLDTFSDQKNGYLFDGDQCEFGVDIIVVPPPTKWEILSFDVKIPYPKFSWTVKKFSEIKGNLHSSDSFSMGGKKWVIKLYPKGHSSADGKWLSIFLFLADGLDLKEDEVIFVQAHLKVEDPYGSNHLTKEVNWWLRNPETGFGRDQYVSAADLRKSYLDKEDTLNVEVKFDVVSATKYSSFT